MDCELALVGLGYRVWDFHCGPHTLVVALGASDNLLVIIAAVET